MTDDEQQAIDDVVGRFYAAFDNLGGARPDINGLRALFTDAAIITRASATSIENWTFDEFVEPREAILTDGTLTEFHEWEIASETAGGNLIASRRSIYRKKGVAGGENYEGGGLKLIQLCKSAEGWLIASVLWEDAGA